MIQSMTAFARSQSQGVWGSAVCELRSINHRYLDLTIRLPEALNAIEAPLRDTIRNVIKRGKIECIVRYQPGDAAGAELTLNHHLVEQLLKASQTIAKLHTEKAPIDVMAILSWPGVIQITELDLVVIQTEIINLLTKALEDLVAAREREGAELKELFLQRLESMKTELHKVRQHLPEMLVLQRERLFARFKEAKLELEMGRLEQEMVLFAQKIDVSEELERIDTHISEVRRVLKHGGLVGRRLDFLMQELNREANTLGAKAVDTATTRVAVELKVLIEQIREQVQNIE